MSNPFDKPLRIGDADQVAGIKAMNGKWLYCPKCYAVFPGGFYRQRCGHCGQGRLIHGAASPAARGEDAVA